MQRRWLAKAKEAAFGTVEVARKLEENDAKSDKIIGEKQPAERCPILMGA